MTIREAVKAARKQSGLIQAELAEKMGVDQRHISRWEAGERTPSPLTISAIEQATGYAITPHKGEWVLITTQMIEKIVENDVRR